MAQIDETKLKQILDELRAYDFQHPYDPSDPKKEKELHCDLVMKGGLTSAAVYPLAVLELAKSHRFHSIGGTSAGAIAAAITAAAEYGRDTGGFTRLIATVEELQKRGFIANVFQPAPELRPLLHLLFIVLKIKRRVKAQLAFPERMEIVLDILKLLFSLTIAPKHMPAFIGGALGGVLGALLGGGWIAAALTAASAGAAVWALFWSVLIISLFWWLGSLIGAIIRMVLTDIPRNGFGICSGLTVPGHDGHRFISAEDEASEGLTDWLSNRINQIAGVSGEPLTFGELLLNKCEKVERKRKIVLNTVTANLSQGQPYILPFTDRQFLFSEQEWRKLFPPDVVTYLTEHDYRSPDFVTPFTIEDDQGQRHTLRFLPESDDLPVIVGARMSLSFPILLSAVPLWTISREMLARSGYDQRSEGQQLELTRKHMRRNWFSDGGACSNFPIHFYDALLPDYPTFGINLDELTQLEEGGTDTASYAVDLQLQQPAIEPNGAEDAEPSGRCPPVDLERGIIFPSAYPKDHPGILWKGLDGNLFGFLGAIIDTGLSYRDHMQARLPSYYDRIITILLNNQEGGINLDMPPEAIRRISVKGHQAGQSLAQCFDFDHHKWVRFRLLLSELEQQMIELHEPLMGDKTAISCEQLQPLLEHIGAVLQESGITKNVAQKLLDDQLNAFIDRHTRFPYARDAEWVQAVLPRLYVLLLMIHVWGGDKDALFQLQHPVMESSDVHDGLDHIRLRVTPDL